MHILGAARSRTHNALRDGSATPHDNFGRVEVQKLANADTDGPVGGWAAVGRRAVSRGRPGKWVARAG